MAPPTDYAAIYRDRVEEYDLMVGAEDCDGALGPAIEAIAPLAAARVIEAGAGTGRVTRLLLERGASVLATDRAPEMLALARRRLTPFPHERWALARAEARALPVASGWADVAIEGWAFGHLRMENGAAWREALESAIAGMERALRPGGALILIETLGTGSEQPHAPSPELAELFLWLEGEQDMGRTVVRTDYRFADPETAARATGFFFGEAFAHRVREHGWSRIPECTGIWSRARR